MTVRFREELLELCEVRFEGDTSIEKSRMMGHPGFKLAHNKKFFLFLNETGLILKLPPDRYEAALQREDMTPFNPTGGPNPMGSWMVWSRDEPNEYESEWEWVEDAQRFTAFQPSKQA
ncbi:hypothetical protein GF324_14230 [bacterium]|nr:hypothetical protein [bacterium]